MMKLIVHDLPRGQEETILSLPREDVRVLSDDGAIRPCIGCFGCWIKTPGQCVIRDHYGDMGELLSKCNEVVLISRCFYGGFSPFIKNVLDRSISYIHPYFMMRNGEMHHRARYANHFVINAFFYGEDMTDREKEIARALVEANSINLHGTVKEIRFAATPEAFGGMLP